MHSLSKQAGTAVREYRKIRKMSLEQLARMIQKSRSTVAKYETGEISMDLDTLYEISQALNAPVEAFFAHLNTQKKSSRHTKKYPGIFPTRLSLWLLPGWPKQHAERFSSQNRSCKWRQRQPVSGFSLYERQGLGASLCL